MTNMMPYRAMFWHIDHVWILYVLAGLATILFLTGLGAYIRVWKESADFSKMSFSGDGLKRMILDAFLGRRLLQGDVAAGLMHLLIFWGFLVLFIRYGHPFGPPLSHLAPAGDCPSGFSLIMEMAGLILLAGIIWALVRRYLQRVPQLERRLEDARKTAGLEEPFRVMGVNALVLQAINGD